MHSEQQLSHTCHGEDAGMGSNITFHLDIFVTEESDLFCVWFVMYIVVCYEKPCWIMFREATDMISYQFQSTWQLVQHLVQANNKVH